MRGVSGRNSHSDGRLAELFDLAKAAEVLVQQMSQIGRGLMCGGNGQNIRSDGRWWEFNQLLSSVDGLFSMEAV